MIDFLVSFCNASLKGTCEYSITFIFQFAKYSFYSALIGGLVCGVFLLSLRAAAMGLLLVFVTGFVFTAVGYVSGVTGTVGDIVPTVLSGLGILFALSLIQERISKLMAGLIVVIATTHMFIAFTIGNRTLEADLQDHQDDVAELSQPEVDLRSRVEDLEREIATLQFRLTEQIRTLADPQPPFSQSELPTTGDLLNCALIQDPLERIRLGCARSAIEPNILVPTLPNDPRIIEPNILFSFPGDDRGIRPNLVPEFQFDR